MGFLKSLFKHSSGKPTPGVVHDEWQKYPLTPLSCKEPSRSEAAKTYLCPDHPRLRELQRRYAGFNKEVTGPLLWQEGHVSPDDLLCFRGDNAYVWQMQGTNMNMPAYALTTYYLKSIDTMGLLERLDEDNCFGCITLNVFNKKVSRDLLDSITEIYFLEKHLHLSTLDSPVILDIGAGYGRLAHRMVQAYPAIQTYICTDAVAVSSFISEFYLRFRTLEDRAKVVPLDEIQRAMEKQRIDVAVNIHSFSECSIPAIEWWLSLLNKHRVSYLMIVPNPLDHGGEQLLTNDRKDICKIVQKHGYHLIAREPKFRDPIIQKYAIMPTYYYLFKLC
jgi:hypothetical protein